MTTDYEDVRGNRADRGRVTHKTVDVIFRGGNNALIIDPGAKLGVLTVAFDCSNATVGIGADTGVASFTSYLRLGEDAVISLGQNVSTTDYYCFMSAVKARKSPLVMTP